MRKFFYSREVKRSLSIVLIIAMLITLLPTSMVATAETGTSDPTVTGTDVALKATATANGEHPSWSIVAANLNNGHEPTASSAPAGSWHDYGIASDDGTSWVQYDWDSEVTVDSMSVYWMNDGVWEDRIPKSTKVEYRDADGNWQMVATYDATVMAEQKADQYNILPLDQEIKTKSIRMTMERNTDGFSSIHRWKVWGKVTPVDVALKGTASANGEHPSWSIVAANLNNGHEPTASSAPAGSWHDYGIASDDGTSWVQYDWDSEVTVDSMSVYWMNDGVWEDRIPTSATVEYKDADGNWQTAATYDATVMAAQKADQYNVLALDQEIKTQSIRMTMVRNTDTFCSIHRWKVWGQIAEAPLADAPVITKTADGYKMVNKYFIVETGKYGQITSLQLQGDEFPTNYVMNAKNSSSQNTTGHQWLGELMFSAKVGDATEYTEQNTNRSDSGRTVELLDDKVVVTYENATEEKGIKDFKVVETYAIVGDKLRWEITVENTNAETLTIGDFGLPLAFNERWPGGEEIYETRTVEHNFIGKNASYVYATRPSGLGMYLLLTPDISTDAGFEYRDHWRIQERADDEKDWCQDQSGWASGLNVYYIHSDYIKKTNRGYLENTKLKLAPGESKTYAFHFSGVEDETDMKSTLYQEGILDAVAVPGMAYSINMPGKFYLHTPLSKDDISFTIQCPHEMNIFTGKGIVHNLPTCNKTTENTYVKYDKTVTIDGEQYHVYDVRFGDLGQNNVVVTYNGGKSQTVLQFYMMDDVAAALTTHSDFMVEKTQFNDPLDISDKIFDDWMMDTKNRRAETDPTYWQKNYWGWGDDWALTHGQYIAEKNVYQPIAKEIKAVDEYLDIAIWNGLMREHQKDYLIHDFYMESPNSSPTYRGYAYPHIYNTYFSMYKIASKYPDMIEYTEDADTYLLRAFNIMKALYRGKGVAYNWSTGVMGELTTPDIIAALEKEGYYIEAKEIVDIMAEKYTNFKDTKYPYGSEYSYDNTGEEAVYTLAKVNLATDTDNAKSMMNKIDLKTRACRGLQPIWYYYANPTTICGDAWWQFQYTAALAGYCMDDWLRLQDNGKTETERAIASRVNYAAKLANLTCINSGQIDADIENIGAVSWTYQAELGNLGGQGTGGGNLHNGWRQMAGESDLGLFGALQILSSDVVVDPVFGLFSYGCNVTENSGVYSVTPLDGLFTRLNFINQELYIELDRDQYTSARVAADNTSIELSMKNLEGTAHKTDVDITGLNPGSYQIYVNGTLTGSFQAVDQKTSTVTLALPAAVTAEVAIKAGTALENQAPVVTLDASKTVAISDDIRLEADATDDGYVNSTLSYSWETVSVPADATAVFTTPDKHITNVTVDKTGDYVFEITVNDGGLSSSKQITVTVTEDPVLPEDLAIFNFNEGTVVGINKLRVNSTVSALQAELEDNTVLVDGKDGKAVLYTGSISGGYIELPGILTKNLQNATISVDVNLSSDQANKTTLFEFGDQVVVEFINGNMISMTVNGQQASTGVEFAPGYWKNVELVVSGDDYILYINGSKKAELLDTGLVLADIDTDTQRYLIGRSNVESDPFLKGMIDNFVIKSVAMTEEELIAVYSDGDHQVISAKTTTIVTNAGIAPVLPEKVSALFTDGVYEPFEVVWNVVSPDSYSKAGTFTVKGYLKDTDIQVSIRVMVVTGTLQNIAGDATPSAIYNNPSDLGGVKGLNDGFDPANSRDTSHGVWHNWGGNNGAPAWIQYKWDETQIIAGVDLYFFKDGNGNFSPSNYSIEYLNEDGNWYAVTNASGLGVNSNVYNKTTFDAVVTKALKITMTPATQGCGVIEWKAYAYQEKIVVDKSALNAAISTAEGLKEALFTAGMDAVKAALADAKTVAADKNSTQESVDAAANALNTAIITLTPIGDNMAFIANVSATYTSSWEKLSSVNDGAVSSVSNSSECSHWGTWGHADVTSETITYTWGLPVKLSSSELYIWNDGGGIQSPTSYVYEYLDSEGVWTEVTNAAGYEINLDGFNITTFDEILTTGFRITMEKESDSSEVGLGLVEWRVIGTKLQQVPGVIITTDPADTTAIPNDGFALVTISSSVTGSAITATGSAISVTGSAIYFTTDGSTPTKNSTLYTGEFILTTNKEAGEAIVIKAIEIIPGWLASSVVQRVIIFQSKDTIPSKLSDPNIITNPTETSAITNSAKITVMLTAAEDGVEIYYTTDGTTPNKNATRYTGEFLLGTSNTAGETKILKVISIKDGWVDSNVIQKVITFLPKESTPTPNPTPTPTPTPTPATTVVEIKGDSGATFASLSVMTQKGKMDISVKINTEELKKQLEATNSSDKVIDIPIITDSLIRQAIDDKVDQLHVSVALPKELLSGDEFDRANINLPEELLKAVKEKGINVTISVKDEAAKELYSWSFDEKDLANSKQSLSDVNLALTVSKVKDHASIDQLLSTTLDAEKGLVISFNQEGILPAQTSVKVFVGDLIRKGSKIYLYCYNSDTNTLDTIPYSSHYYVDAEGYITMDLIHCNDEYVILTKPADKKVITSLRGQIKVSVDQTELYVGGTNNKKAQLTIKVPSTLEIVSSLEDKTSSKALGAVTVTHKSSNKKVIKVDSKGEITAVGAGTATIVTTIKLYSNKVVTIKTKITVKKAGISFKSTSSSMKVGDTFVFKIDAKGLDTSKTKWETSNKSVITINKEGKATAVSKGTAYITAKIGKVTKKVKVVVK